MLHTEPAVRATVVEWRRRWQELLEPAVAERLPARRGGGPDVRASSIVACALACLETAQAAWADHPGSRLATLLDQAMSALPPATPA